MKKITTVLAAAAALLLGASSAMAAALGPHQADGATNPCKVCHDTAAGTPALRGWAGAGTGPATGWGSKAISGLCYKCHESGGGTIPLKPGHNMLSNAYDDLSHGYITASVPEAPEGSAQTGISASGLPYTAATIAQIECTSCHNVHVETSRPFNQRAGYQLMCDECHVGRVNNASGTTFAGTLHAYSTHPTQQTLIDTARANLKLEGAIAANLRVATPAAPNYALGGHLSAGATGVMDCQTCHAVHGPVQGTPGNNDLLAIDNTTGASGSALCEGCHFGGVAGEQVGSVVLQSTLPAGQFSDHPIDANNNRTFYPTGVAIPADWGMATPNLDRGAQPFYPVTLAPTCSSCHDTHGGIANTPLLRGPQPVAGFGVMDYGDWCFACHTAAQVIPNNHHSVIGNLATSQLECGDCHGGIGATNWLAHNGFWTFAVAISATDSAFCQGCHVADNPTAFVAGGLKTTQTFDNTTLPARHGVIRDAATLHSTTHQTNEPVDGTNLNMDLTPDWTTAVAGNTAALGYVSEWGGTANTPICESCHNILHNGVAVAQGLANGWQANLLLAPYEDDSVGTGLEANDFYGDATYGAGRTGVNMCRACHRGNGTTVPVGFVHNPSAHTVDSAAYTYAAGTEPYGRTTNTVLTAGACPEMTTADMAAAPNGLSYPAANQVDCDSCHRPHNADADSLDAVGNRHLILEITDANWGTTICAECHNTDIQCN